MIQFYKPNAKVTGSACSFWLNPDGSVMTSMIKQDSWNGQKKTGSFVKNKENPNGRVIVKLSLTEVGGIIDTIESGREFSAYHSSQNQVLQIKFAQYMDKASGSQKGFSFSVNKQDKADTNNKVGFIIGFTFPESRYLAEYLQFVLNAVFDKNMKESLERSNNKKAERPPKEAVVDAKEIEEEDDSWDEW